MDSYDDAAEMLWQKAQLRENLTVRLRHILTFFVLIPIAVSFLYIVVYFSTPIHGILEKQEEILAAQVNGMKKIPILEEKLIDLDSKLNILTTKSIETRLCNIENAINSGKLNLGEISNFIKVQNEVQELKTYMFRDPKELVELKQLQSNYHILKESTEKYITHSECTDAVDSVRNLLFISLTFLGIIFTIIFAIIFAPGFRRKNLFLQPLLTIKKRRFNYGLLSSCYF